MVTYRRGILLSLLSGVLLALCFEPFALSWLMFIALVPLFFALFNEQNFWRILSYAWLTVAIQSLISFQWIHFVSREFGSLGWGISLLVLLAFSLLANFYLQIFALMFYFFRRLLLNKKHLLYLLIVPSTYVLSEWIDPRVFSWSIGDALSTYKYLPQFADVFGVYGLSYLCVMINSLIFISLSTFLSSKNILKKSAILPIVICTIIITSLLLYGYIQSHDDSGVHERSVKFGVVQANIGNPVQLKIAEAVKIRQDLNMSGTEFADDSDLI